LIGREKDGVREKDSRIPSISTGGAAMNAIIKTEVAVNKVGIIKTPNHHHHHLLVTEEKS
jgi:hypothetical protein